MPAGIERATRVGALSSPLRLNQPTHSPYGGWSVSGRFPSQTS